MQQTRTYYCANFGKIAKILALFVLIVCLTVQFWFPLLRRGFQPVDSCYNEPARNTRKSAKNGDKQIVKRDCVINLNNRKYDSLARIGSPKELQQSLKRIKVMQSLDSQNRQKESNSIAHIPPSVHKKNVHKDKGHKTNNDVSGTNERKNNIGLHFVGFGYSLKKLK